MCSGNLSFTVLKNFLVFISANKYIEFLVVPKIWKSMRISDENTKTLPVSDNCFAPTFIDYHLIVYTPGVKFRANVSRLNITSTHKNVGVFYHS